MNILTFKYAKSPSDISMRTLAVLIKPSTMYEGTDMSPLEPIDLALYAKEYDELHTEFLNSIARLNDKFDLNNQYRRFDPKKMSDVISEHI